MTGHEGAARPGADVRPMDGVNDRESNCPDRPGESTPTASTLPSTRWRQKLVFGLVFCAAMAATGVSLWAFVLRDRLVPKRFGVVVPGEVYRSGQISRYLIQGVIEQNRIGTIVDLNGPEPSIAADQQAEAEISEAKHVRHERFPLKGDGTGKIERYADAIAALTTSQHSRIPVLVHCASGTQRTGACVVFYRLLVRKERPEDAYQELLRYGWDPVKNSVLLDYVNAHMQELAELLVQRHVLERVPDPIPSLHP